MHRITVGKNVIILVVFLIKDTILTKQIHTAISDKTLHTSTDISNVNHWVIYVIFILLLLLFYIFFKKKKVYYTSIVLSGEQKIDVNYYMGGRRVKWVRVTTKKLLLVSYYLHKCIYIYIWMLLLVVYVRVYTNKCFVSKVLGVTFFQDFYAFIYKFVFRLYTFKSLILELHCYIEYLNMLN